MPEVSDVIITIETAKLPPEYADLADPLKPLPPGVALFAKLLTVSQLVKTAALAIGIAGLGVVAVIFGILELFTYTGVQPRTSTDYLPLGFGLVCLLAAWMMVDSIRAGRDLMRRQKRGEHTRVGIVLTPEALFQVGETSYCIIPRSHFRGLSGDNVRYVFKEQEKSFRLPEALVGSDVLTMKAAIDQWSKEAVPQKP